MSKYNVFKDHEPWPVHLALGTVGSTMLHDTFHRTIGNRLQAAISLPGWRPSASDGV